MNYPTDYERDERRDQAAAKIERQIDKADYERDRRKDDDHGPQRRPASVRQVEAQRKSVVNDMSNLRARVAKMREDAETTARRFEHMQSPIAANDYHSQAWAFTRVIEVIDELSGCEE
jgi:septal ring factor EnvC (AmiA/AmiB activator)